MTSPLPLRDVIARYGLNAKKSLGQHFLLDGNLLAKIVRHAGDLSDVQVIEIGPGPGGLTRALLDSEAEHIWAVERDDRAVRALAELACPRLSLVADDAMEWDVAQVPKPRAIVANLPYNIGTELLIHWLEEVARDADAFLSMTLMFQKEVAMRLCAEPRSKDYGRLSVMAQWLCEVSREFDVPPEAFTPPPKVVSSIVRLVPRKHRIAADRDRMELVLKTAFGQRRKMLRQSLKPLGDEAWLEKAGIKPTARAEELSVEDFCRLVEVK